MARFVFELQAVLEHRRREERRLQRRLAELDRRRRDLESLVSDLGTRIEHERALIRGAIAGEGPADVRAACLQIGSASGLARQREQRAHELGRAQEAVEDARAELRRAATARRAVENLRDRRYQEWVRERERRAQAELDDLANSRAARGITSEDQP